MNKEMFFFKKYDDDKVWWVEYKGQPKDEYLFSFDKQTIFNLFEDHDKMTNEQKEIFFKENPVWAEFFGYKIK